MFDVFEQPWTMLIAAVALLLVIWVFRAVCPDKKRWWQWLLPLFLIAGAFGLDYLVETDLEKIKTTIYSITKAVEEENAKAIEALISDDYSDSFHRTKNHFMNRCRTRLSKPFVAKNITRILSVETPLPEATAVFTVRVMFDPESFVYRAYKHQLFAKVETNLKKEKTGDWLICRIEILELDRMRASWEQIR